MIKVRATKILECGDFVSAFSSRPTGRPGKAAFSGLEKVIDLDHATATVSANRRTPMRMKKPAWQTAAKKSADPARAKRGFEALFTSDAGAELSGASSEHLRILATLFAGSQSGTVLLLKHPEWSHTLLTPGNLEFPRRLQGLEGEVSKWLEAPLRTGDYPGGFAKLRHFKQREMLRIAARDLSRLGDAPQITSELSNVADVCLSAALELSLKQLVGKLGTPYHLDASGAWRPTQFSVLGLGKLGGQELNYNSDVDLLFVYSEEGHVFKARPSKQANGDGAMTNHQFFRRLAELFIGEVTRASEDGTLFRIDLRLRPEGDAGPLVRSLGSYESFYAQWGQTWERMMLIKARCVAGDAALASEFLETVQSFRYPRSTGEGVVREIAATRGRIEREVASREDLDSNVKLGRGGIRDIEFVVQTAQVLHAGRIPFLQGAQTLPALKKLVEYQFLGKSEARDLAAAYMFLREVEHRLQMENDLPTHVLPKELPARTRIAKLTGFATLAGFDKRLKGHTDRVRAIYEKFIGAPSEQIDTDLPTAFRGAEKQWRTILERHHFQDIEKSLRLIEAFVSGPGHAHVSQRTTDLAMKLIPRVLALCRGEVTGAGKPPGRTTHIPSFNAQKKFAPATREPRLSDPDRVLARLDSFISAYGARPVMFETWTSHPHLFELLVLMFDRSEFLAEIAIRTPDLVDELVMSGRLGRSKNSDEILNDLRHGKNDADQKLWLRKYHEAEFMRIGLRSILGLADHEQNFLELSALADACLQYALEASLRNHKLSEAHVAIIGLGKLGGRELNYGSDLDIFFVTDDNSAEDLPALQKAAMDVLDLLSSKTELGVAFATDARLRPDGEKGLLVNTLSACESYYRNRAQLWEIQALTRTRPVAGDMALGERFQTLVRSLTDFRRFASGESKAPACYTPDWKRQIALMRERIEKERTPPGQEALAFKTGSGGVIDADSIAQAMCLEHGWHEPSTLCALQRVRGDHALPTKEADKLLDNYRKLRRLESILRRWSFEGEAVLPADEAAFNRVAIRCGFDSANAFREAVAGWRRAIREVYHGALSGTIKSG